MILILDTYHTRNTQPLTHSTVPMYIVHCVYMSHKNASFIIFSDAKRQIKKKKYYKRASHFLNIALNIKNYTQN